MRRAHDSKHVRCTAGGRKYETSRVPEGGWPATRWPVRIQGARSPDHGGCSNHITVLSTTTMSLSQRRNPPQHRPVHSRQTGQSRQMRLRGPGRAPEAAREDWNPARRPCAKVRSLRFSPLAPWARWQNGRAHYMSQPIQCSCACDVMPGQGDGCDRMPVVKIWAVARTCSHLEIPTIAPRPGNASVTALRNNTILQARVAQPTSNV